MSIEAREKRFYDEKWKQIELHPVSGDLAIPGVADLRGRRVLICSCGTGQDPVRAARQGARTFAFDLSDTAVNNALAMARYHGVTVTTTVANFHHLPYADDSFDIVYGAFILHHVDCQAAGREMHRVLKPGGMAFFRENSDRNPLLRALRRALFGAPGGHQKQRFLFLRRTGSSDEYPLTEEEVAELASSFGGQVEVQNERFYFLTLLNLLIFKHPVMERVFSVLDALIVRTLPGVRKYSFLQELILKKSLRSP